MSKHLPICPSNLGGDDGFTLYHTPCEGKSCGWWRRQPSGKFGCTAGLEEQQQFAKWFTTTRDENMPPCPAASYCRWNMDAVKRGEPGCLPRRLGLLCEHQGGIWNTFDMADPDDPCWSEEYENAMENRHNDMCS